MKKTDKDLKARPSRENTEKRQRLLDTALTLFAERGFAAVGMREIAAAADVSLGLIRIHFGSKDGLREELDAYVLHEIDTFYVGIIEFGGIAGVEYMTEDVVDMIVRDKDVLMYLRMALLEKTPGSQAMINHILGITRQFIDACEEKGTLQAGVDKEQAALVLLFDLLGPLILEPFAEAALGRSMYDREMVAGRNDLLRRMLTRGFLEK